MQQLDLMELVRALNRSFRRLGQLWTIRSIQQFRSVFQSNPIAFQAISFEPPAAKIGG